MLLMLHGMLLTLHGMLLTLHGMLPILCAEHPADGQQQSTRRVRSQPARQLPAAADRLEPGAVHQGKVRGKKIHRQRVGAATAPDSKLGPTHRETNQKQEKR